MWVEQLQKWVMENPNQFLILIFTASSLTLALYERFRRMTRFKVQEFNITSYDDFDFVILNDSESEAPRCHTELSVYKKDGTQEMVLSTLNWEVPEFGGRFVKWHICDMKPKAHYLLQSKVPKEAGVEYKTEHKNAEISSNCGFHYMHLRIWKGGEITGHLYVLWYYIPRDYVRGSGIPHGQIGRLRTGFPKQIWSKLMKRKLSKASRAFD